MRLTPRVAGFRLEYPAGFELECMAGFVGTRTLNGLIKLAIAKKGFKTMKSITRRLFSGGIALLPALRFAPAIAQTNVSPAEARAIAKEAYIYGFPVVDNYRIQYAYFVDTKNREYKASWNKIWNSARLFTPADKAIQTANSDTLYSMVGADLRAEPIVLTVPAMEKDRYFSV
jgi:hypothetical protein